MPWYAFTPDGLPRNPGDPNQYTYVGSVPPTCSGTNIYLCAIQASDNMGKPIISCALGFEIAHALDNHTNSTNVVLKPFA